MSRATAKTTRPSEATNPPYPFAWRYRDWIIEALNADMPYDRFVKLQLAADLMPEDARATTCGRSDMWAPPPSITRICGSRARSSARFLTDDWDERIDAVSRGVLGVTVACARCHDHKFDPIPTEGLLRADGRVRLDDARRAPVVRRRSQDRTAIHVAPASLFDLAYSINLLGNEGTTVDRRRRESGEVESARSRASRRRRQPC